MDDGHWVADMTGVRLHADNAAAMWAAVAGDEGTLLRTPRIQVTRPSSYHPLRAIVLDPGPDHDPVVRQIVDAVLRRPDAARRVVEDPGGVLDLRTAGFAPSFRMTVMVRDPGPLPPSRSEDGRGRPAVEVIEVDAPRRLAEAEWVLTTVFPPAPSGTDWAGQIQPERVLDLPGWRVWLGCREAVPAGAAYTYHDGASVGLYQVGTLAEHRGHGVARALVEAILRAYPDVPASLTATDQGRPLYERLGFRPVSQAVWWTPDPTGDDIGSALR